MSLIRAFSKLDSALWEINSVGTIIECQTTPTLYCENIRCLSLRNYFFSRYFKMSSTNLLQKYNAPDCVKSIIDQFRYIKIQPKTIDLSTRLSGITTEFGGFISWSLVLRSIVLG